MNAFSASLTPSNLSAPGARRRLLMLTHRVPYPPDRGDRIRSWNILRHLANSYDISLGCVSEEPICPQSKAHLETVCQHVSIAAIGPRSKWLRAGASAARGRSLTEGLFWSPGLSKTIDRWAAAHPFDGVLVYCSGMLRYARQKCVRDLPHFVDLVDVDSQKFYEYANHAPLWKRSLYRTEGRRVRRLEHDAVRAACAVTLVSDAEADILRGTLASSTHPIHGIANGVDIDYFHPAPPDSSGDSAPRPSAASPDLPTEQGFTPNAPRLVFVGVLNYLPNIQAIRWFADQVWPHVTARYPQATIEVVGKHPTPEVLRLGRIPGIRVVGKVPDVRPHLRQATIVIAPLQIARGVQNKVLEAMAMARPVIATPAAATGIQAIDGQHLLLADSPSEWLAQISRLQTDSTFAQHLATQARTLVCQHYTWPATLAKLTEILQENLGRSGE